MSKRKLKKKVKIVFFIIVLVSIILISSVVYLSFNDKDKLKHIDKNTTVTTTSTTKKVDRKANLTLVGDLLFEQPFYDAVDNGYDKNIYFSLVSDYFKNDDLSLGNMEVVIGNENLKSSGTGYNFCAPEHIGDLVSTLDFEVLSTANNHSYDRGIDGINSTLDYFKNKTDILTVGTYRDISDRNNYRIININDISFGFLSYVYGTNIRVDKEYRDLVGLYRNPENKTFDDEYKTKITNEVNTVRDKVDVLVVMMHWGTEFTYTPNKEQKEMANYLNSLGVDIIYGSHSHCMQPIEVIGSNHKTLVYYSLGNFVSADDDIARTAKGQETFDNSYQIGLLSNLTIKLDKDNKVSFEDIKTEPIINYFDSNMNNFKLIPFSKYTENDEKTHFRYNYGLTKDFINNTFTSVIDEQYR